jgi:hypothetical protein
MPGIAERDRHGIGRVTPFCVIWKEGKERTDRSKSRRRRCESAGDKGVR